MIRTEIQLEVPADSALRLAIRRKAEAFFREKNIIPPVSYNDLSDYADELMLINGWGGKSKAFIMVCCGNAIWQPYVSSVPFNRRILLLPQCMSNSKLCRAEHDELGLLCSACNNCSISGLLHTAEKLGYITLVTEGTTITSRLIEEGKADAVIGVSCMEVLEKMYDSVAKYAVPGIGIPLHQAGCVDTTTDLEWVKEALLRYNDHDGQRLLNLNYLRNETSAFFTREQLNLLMGVATNSTEQLIRDYMLIGGKRIRPLLTILTYEACSKKHSSSDLSRLALAIECFHKASLIHDDIEDDDPVRYGQETLHSKYGIPVAINAGDLLIGEGYRLIAETNLDPRIIHRCIHAAAEGHRLLATGQGMELMALRNREILTIDQTLTVFDYKAATAFKVALLLGAIAGEADQGTLLLLQKFSFNMGVAYQIMDDMQDFTGPTGEISPGKSSVYLSLLMEYLGAEDQVLFQGAYYSSDFNKIKQFIDQYGIGDQAQKLLDKFLEQTRTCLKEFKNPALKLALHEMVGKIFRDYL